MQKVSVIIPVYNVEKYLARCLDSVVNQTLKDIEIICVNDGSTDNSAQILEEYAQKNERIKVIKQVNSGISISRNIGILNATGEFVAFLDADDYVEKDYYEKLYNVAKKYDAYIACGGVVRESEKKKKILIKYHNEQSAESVKEKFELAGVPEHCYVWNKIYNREKLVASGLEFQKCRFYEDMIFTPDILEIPGTLVTVPDTNYHYWKHSSSIIKTPTDKNRADKLYAKKYVIEKCRKYNLKLKEKDYIICKREYYLFGIKVLKVYEYRATKIYCLFGLIPFLTVKENA